MSRQHQIINERRKKLQELRKITNPYPYKFNQKDFSEDIKNKHQKLKPNQKSKTKAQIAGRVMTIRNLGKLIFATVYDSKGKIQLILQKPTTNPKDFEFFKKYIDIGDIIGASGIITKTKTGELSLLTKNLQLLTKSLLPLPEKWHGLQDKEERYRKRYLDLIINPEIKQIFKKRSETINALREFLLKKEFLEVDTPVLQPIAGGAIAKPFVTKYNAYDTDVYLRIAPELYLKRLLVGGFDKVFEFSKCFRNEGVDWSHNPEFTNLEFYQSYIDYNKLMKLTEELITEVVKKVNGKAEIERNNQQVSVGGQTNLNRKENKNHVGGRVGTNHTQKIKIKKPFKRITFEKLTKGKMTDESFKEAIKKIKEPTFIINHPIDISPLAKKNDNKTVQRFQLIIDGIEIVNAFSELNDPEDQEQRFKEQTGKKADEKHEHDKDFVDALKHGMPPAAGFGMGVDRFVMLLTGKNSLREVLLFPYMKGE